MRNTAQGAVLEPAAVDLGDLAGADLLGQFGDLGDVGLEIGAGHEVAVDAGDDRHPGLVVVAEVLPRLGQIPEVVQVQAVAGFRSIDGDDHDVVVTPFVVDGHGVGQYLTPASHRQRLERLRLDPGVSRRPPEEEVTGILEIVGFFGA